MTTDPTTRNEPCPNCEGFCCRADSGMIVEHRSSRYARHVCPDCDAGLVWTAHTEPAPRPDLAAERLVALLDAERENTALRSEVARLRGEAERERADVLAYLAYARTFPFTYDKVTPAILDALRDLIEQGQHEGWAKKEEP